MIITVRGPRPRSLGERTPYSALSGTQRTRQRKARASQYIISNAETLQSNFTLFAIVLPYVSPPRCWANPLESEGHPRRSRFVAGRPHGYAVPKLPRLSGIQGTGCTATAPERGE